VPFFCLHCAARGFDFVGGGVRLRAKFSNNAAVDANLAGENQLFGVTPRGNSSPGDNFLQAFQNGGGRLLAGRLGLGFRIRRRLEGRSWRIFVKLAARHPFGCRRDFSFTQLLGGLEFLLQLRERMG